MYKILTYLEKGKYSFMLLPKFASGRLAVLMPHIFTMVS